MRNRITVNVDRLFPNSGIIKPVQQEVPAAGTNVEQPAEKPVEQPARYLRLSWRNKGLSEQALFNSIPVAFNGKAVIWTSGKAVFEIPAKDLFEAEEKLKEFYQELLRVTNEKINECEEAVKVLRRNNCGTTTNTLIHLYGRRKNYIGLIARLM